MHLWNYDWAHTYAGASIPTSQTCVWTQHMALLSKYTCLQWILYISRVVSRQFKATLILNVSADVLYKHKYTFAFYITPGHWYSKETRGWLFRTVNTDGWVQYCSAGIRSNGIDPILPFFIPVSASERIMHWCLNNIFQFPGEINMVHTLSWTKSYIASRRKNITLKQKYNSCLPRICVTMPQLLLLNLKMAGKSIQT